MNNYFKIIWRVVLFAILLNLNSMSALSQEKVLITDYNYKPGDRKNVIPAIMAALKVCAEKESSVLVFPKGRYDFWPDFSSQQAKAGNDSQDKKSYNTDFTKYEKKSTWTVSKELVAARTAERPLNNFDESKVPDYTLPDIFTLKNGEKVTTTEVWENQRRDELLDLFCDVVYGYSPPKPDNLTFKIIETNPKAMDGKATLKRVAISFQLQGEETFTFNLTLFVPNNRQGKVPVFLLLNHRNIENTDPQRKTLSEFWPAEYVIGRGYAIAAINMSLEVEPDRPGATTGVRLFYKQHYEKPEELTWGTLAAWAWSGSRAVDYFETDPDINLSQIAVIGHSRGGKTALWAGAQDTRFALVCPNNNALGGSTLIRRRFGANIQVPIVEEFPHWMSPKYYTYAGREDDMPIDAHELVALVAPRGYHQAEASEDLWSDPRGSWLSVVEASKVWEMYGKAAALKDEMPLLNDMLVNGQIAFHMREGGHNLTLFDWKLYLDHADILFSCSQHRIQISNLSGTVVGFHAANELEKYLCDMYTGVQLSIVESNYDANVQFLLSEQAKEMGFEPVPTEKESFKIIQKEGKLFIISPDERGLLNATYHLLEKLGCGFYISGDVIPEREKWPGFDGWEMKDAPLTGDRFLFNWHNFLSGCTGWNLEDWQMWVDQANKMRYNGIMVHAYGNNPMFSFEYLGKKKQTGYLNNTTSGRDWGNQHVNDVRQLAGGEIFDAPVFGAKASLASEENKEKKATELMQQVFQYAEDRGTKVIFALDFDTWMSNPRNIIEKLPKEAVFELTGGHITPNPDHPEGYKYFKQVLKSLLEMYPQIDQLSVWHRTPGTKGLGSIWMSFPYEKFPANWKTEYEQKLKDHPDIQDNLMASGTFAYGKLIATLQKARDEIEPELVISSGSWSFEYVPYADAMYPTDVPLLPLDWQVIFDTPESKEILTNAGKNREMYPIIWAHHDDHRYIGRPYTPWENLSEMLKERHSKGFGIIHWTTRPLDLYFTSSGRQVWESTENEPIQKTVENYVKTNFGEYEKLSQYYLMWLTEGPIFGRETSDHFVDLGTQNLGHKLESWEEMSVQAEKRLEVLNGIPLVEENSYLRYQKAMEEFYISFFENQQLFVEAFELARKEKLDEAIEIIQKTNPDEAIQKYADAIKNVGFTSGEKALVFSMNTRWKADFINLRQRLGMEPVRLKFAPTQHDPLAQGPGHYSYFIDDNGLWWRCLWKHELENESFIERGGETALRLTDEFNFDLKSMHGQNIPADYRVEVKYTYNNKAGTIEVMDGSEISTGEGNEIQVSCVGGKLNLKFEKRNGELCLSEIIISPAAR